MKKHYISFLLRKGKWCNIVVNVVILHKELILGITKCYLEYKKSTKW